MIDVECVGANDQLLNSGSCNVMGHIEINKIIMNHGWDIL